MILFQNKTQRENVENIKSKDEGMFRFSRLGNFPERISWSPNIYIYSLIVESWLFLIDNYDLTKRFSSMRDECYRANVYRGHVNLTMSGDVARWNSRSVRRTSSKGKERTNERWEREKRISISFSFYANEGKYIENVTRVCICVYAGDLIFVVCTKSLVLAFTRLTSVTVTSLSGHAIDLNPS